MLMVDIIKKKRDGEKLTKEEIDYVIDGYVSGQIPDYQVSALMMAIFFSKMDDEETVQLTEAMTRSGETLDLSGINGFKVDKHSAGGVGDKTTICLGPMVASIGVPVAKMSGRGLGHTGGTIDKFESFNGFRVSMTNDEFIEKVNNVGIAIMGQTANLAPADKLLYALRDVTATVDNMSLIASSIMSKKIAAGANGIVLDVTCGSGAFMKTEEDAFMLAQKMVNIGKGSGLKIMAVVSNMDEPLGYAVGNSLEVKEAIEMLKGNGPEDLEELCLALGSYMTVFAGKAESIDDARCKLKESIDNGSALKKLADLVESQGGNREDVYDTSRLPKADIIKEIKATTEGYVESIMAEEVGVASLILGGGRRNKSDTIDLAVGIILNKKVGDKVNIGDTIATIHANDITKLEEAEDRLLGAYSFTPNCVPKQTLIKGIVE